MNFGQMAKSGIVFIINFERGLFKSYTINWVRDI